MCPARADMLLGIGSSSVYVCVCVCMCVLDAIARNTFSKSYK